MFGAAIGAANTGKRKGGLAPTHTGASEALYLLAAFTVGRILPVKSWARAAAFAFMAAFLWSGVVRADPPGNPAAVKNEDGKYYDAQGNPTFSIQPDGTVDWYTYSGYIRYGMECLRCHGPDGEGSSYAPSLVDALKTSSYTDFLGIVAGGKRDVTAAQDLVMPAFGTDKNVMCFIDDIYIYLRARANGALGRGRPAKHADKPEAAKNWENTCMGPE
jgi:methanol metabolism-related c-type cytochrome